MTMRFQGMFATSSDLPPGVLHFLGNVSALELHAWSVANWRQPGGADLRAGGDELLHVEALDDDQAHGPR